MWDRVAQGADQTDRVHVMAAVAELADGGLAERMRLDAAARVLVTARRAAALAPHEASPGSATAIVLRVARGWDPAVTTAAEHVEALAPAELDSFLAAAPRWAASVRDAGRAALRRAA
ncbi:hypothetical protein [Falsiroseomonas sp.]|uniref:hypothetical protein n=1 Tax=Falsiroseomonas sp. TaxID=2870721 RepID=UPI003567556C